MTVVYDVTQTLWNTQGSAKGDKAEFKGEELSVTMCDIIKMERYRGIPVHFDKKNSLAVTKTY